MHWYCYLKVKGSSQGGFKSDSPHGRKEAILCYEYGFEGFVQDHQVRDAAAAVRTHEPFRILKGRDSSSVQFSKAFWANEVLSEVIVEIVAPNKQGDGDTLMEKYILKDATVARLKRTGGSRGTARDDEFPAELEEVFFRFQSARHESTDAKMVAVYEFGDQPK